MNEVTYTSVRADRITPQVAYLKLNAKALLESAVLNIGRSRYSFLLVSERFRLISDAEGVIQEFPDHTREIVSPEKQSYLAWLKKFSSEARDINRQEELPFPLPLGGVGFLGYEAAASMDEIYLQPQQHDLGLPEAVFLFGESFVVFDHYKDELIICAVHKPGSTDGKQIISSIKQRLFDYDFRAYQEDDREYPHSADLHAQREAFIEGVASVRDAVIRGDLLQGVLSHRITAASHIPPFEAYRRLRRENPSPYMFFIDFTSFTLFGASPEVMVKYSQGVATVKPIAGTRPRGKTKKEDVRMEQDLLEDEKERAEHLMLIDLARNDLNRVCVPGTVQVLHQFQIERYSHVMHIVSEVEGELGADHDVFDLIRATFPAGTVSGAPKIKAVELISGIEPSVRGPYAGLVGYFDIMGGFDSCITIRSVVHRDGKYYIQAGAGIVYDSVPEREYQETVSKAAAMCASIGVTL